MGEFGLRWILAALGAVIIVAIYLWGTRARFQEKLRERRRRAKTLSLEGQPGLNRDDPDDPLPNLKDFNDISPDHHLAEKMLVDVEITPVKHPRTEPEEARKVDHEPTAHHQPAVAKPSLEPAGKPAPAETIREPVPTSGAVPAEKPELVEPVDEPKEQENVPESVEQRELEVTETPTKTVVLTVMAPAGRPYRGPSILLAAQELKLKLHKNGVFDYFPPDRDARKPVFSVAHLREPGTFDLDTVGKLATPGLLMFMNLPGPVQAVKAVESILEVAKQLSQKLGGTVCNESRHKLTLQNTLQLKGEAADFDRRPHQARQ